MLYIAFAFLILYWRATEKAEEINDDICLLSLVNLKASIVLLFLQLPSKISAAVSLSLHNFKGPNHSEASCQTL